MDTKYDDVSYLPKTFSEDEIDLKKMYKSFTIFKKCYEKHDDCTKQVAIDLNHMQNVLEFSLYDKLYKKYKINQQIW